MLRRMGFRWPAEARLPPAPRQPAASHRHLPPARLCAVLALGVVASASTLLRAAWGPFVGEAGTYEVTGVNLITMRPIVAKNPAVMGPAVVLTYAYKLEGDTLWVTQQRNQNGPFANPFTLELVRVE